MPIREFFHLIHVVDDLDAAVSRYGQLFGSEPFSSNWSDLDRRWASFSMLSDMMLELIQPSSAEEDQSRPLTKFHRRFGPHLHSLSWYVDMPDMAPLFRDLRRQGVRVAKPGGGLFPEDTDDPGMTMFTHAKDTAGQLEFVGVEGGPLEMDPRSKPGWAVPAPSASPLGVEHLSHFTTSTRDLPGLHEFYEKSLAAKTLYTTGSSAFVQVGTHSVVELATTDDADSLLGRDLTANGELPHAVTFKVVDLDTVDRQARTFGVGVHERSGDTLVLDPRDTFGAVIGFTARDVRQPPA